MVLVSFSAVAEEGGAFFDRGMVLIKNNSVPIVVD